MQVKQNFHHGNYFVLNRKELLLFFLKQKRINNILCKCCKEKYCYICNRFAFIKEELLKNGFFEKMPDGQQPVLWQVFNNFKTPNRADKNIFKFRFFIEKKVCCNFLIKDFDFNENKITEIYKC